MKCYSGILLSGLSTGSDPPFFSEFSPWTSIIMENCKQPILQDMGEKHYKECGQYPPTLTEKMIHHPIFFFFFQHFLPWTKLVWKIFT